MGARPSDAERWLALNALALRLAEAGRLPTQIHFTGKAPDQWDYCGQEAAMHSWADADQVVTSDGEIHTP